MTPEQLKAELAENIKLLEGTINRATGYAQSLGRRYGVYGFGDPTDILDTRNRLRALQEQLLTDDGKAEFLANVRTLDEKGLL